MRTASVLTKRTKTYPVMEMLSRNVTAETLRADVVGMIGSCLGELVDYGQYTIDELHIVGLMKYHAVSRSSEVNIIVFADELSVSIYLAATETFGVQASRIAPSLIADALAEAQIVTVHHRHVEPDLLDTP